MTNKDVISWEICIKDKKFIVIEFGGDSKISVITYYDTFRELEYLEYSEVENYTLENWIDFIESKYQGWLEWCTEIL